MYQTPAELLALDKEPVARLLRACGVEEKRIRSGSDYDRFVAFATCMPLCAGHTLATSMERDLQNATGLTAPLCSHTAPAFWRRWLELHWCEQEETVSDPTPCAACEPCEPLRLTDAEAVRLPALAEIATACHPVSLVAFADRLQAALPTVGHAVIRLPADYAFVRPDPYHATEALKGAAAGGAYHRDMLVTQALRVSGGIAVSRGITLVLTGGTPENILPLLAYLAGCGNLPHTVWMPDDPAHAASVSGLYAAVDTGYVLSSRDAEADLRASYAAVAPIGRAVVYETSDQ